MKEVVILGEPAKPVTKKPEPKKPEPPAVTITTESEGTWTGNEPLEELLEEEVPPSKSRKPRKK